MIVSSAKPPTVPSNAALFATVTVENREVGLSVRVLQPNEREVVAASMAWLAGIAFSERDVVTHSTWTTFVEELLGAYVSFDVDDDEPERLGPIWWDEVIRSATTALIRANGLEPLIDRFLSSFGTHDGRRRTMC
jgi:hypothetical protein